MFAAGDAELDLAADLLANGKTSRLYRRLVFESGSPPTCRRRRTRARSAASSRSPRPRRPATRSPSSSASIVEEIARLAADGPTTDEIERGRVQAEAQFVFRLQTVGGFGGKSDQLNAYNVFVGDPGFFDRDLAALSARDRRRRFSGRGRHVPRSAAAG